MPSQLWREFVEGEHYEVADTGCWLWLGRVDHAGYGMCAATAGEVRAARASFALANGPIADGNHIHHVCKTVACINPAHLKQLTSREHFLLHKLTEQTGLTLDDVREIRQLGRTPHVRAQDVADQYGIHVITVFNYWGKEQVWADLLDDGPMVKPTRVCPWCGGEFSDRNRWAKYCSPEHANLYNQAKRAGRLPHAA